WQNSVYVIRKIGFPRNKLLLPNLIWLLQDINWPGALISIDVLADIEKEELIPLIETAITKAYEIKDYMWLGGLKMLIDKTNIQANDFCNSEVFCLLKYADF
ncbi:MAG: DUF5071 domain-containing protein, partial [Clostridiales bacterium]|nr:DUF5071 domain-containing protein [Clostridiales bacterium]